MLLTQLMSEELGVDNICWGIKGMGWKTFSGGKGFGQTNRLQNNMSHFDMGRLPLGAESHSVGVVL